MRPHRISSFAFLVSMALLTLAACGGNRPAASVDPDAPTSLTVENYGFLDVTVYVIRGGTRIRLGQASGNGSETFVIPAHLVQAGIALRFQADPIGRRAAPVTEDIVVFPGDQLVLRIPR